MSSISFHGQGYVICWPIIFKNSQIICAWWSTFLHKPCRPCRDLGLVRINYNAFFWQIQNHVYRWAAHLLHWISVVCQPKLENLFLMPHCKRWQHPEQWACLMYLDDTYCCSQLSYSWGMLEAKSSEIALFAHASWRYFSLYRPPGIIQFSWRINAHGGVKPHGAVSIGKPFPCVTKYCHFSVVPDCSHSPVSQLPEWFSRKDWTCDKLNPRLSLCLVLVSCAFGRHPRGLWLRALLALLWCRTGVSERYPSGRCSLHRCVPDKPVCWTCRWSTAEIVSQTWEPGVYRV